MPEETPAPAAAESTLAGVTGQLNERIAELKPHAGESFFTPKRLMIIFFLLFGAFVVFTFFIRRKVNTQAADAATQAQSAAHETVINITEKIMPPPSTQHQPPPQPPPVHVPPPQPPPIHIIEPPFIPPPEFWIPSDPLGR